MFKKNVLILVKVHLHQWIVLNHLLVVISYKYLQVKGYRNQDILFFLMTNFWCQAISAGCKQAK